MSASALVETLRARGVNLSAQAGKLVYDAPAGVLTDADRTALREHKAALLALLAPSPLASAPPVATAPERPGAPKECFSHEQEPEACRRCGGRAWRLRETPQSAGGWLWICAACADHFGDTKIGPYVAPPVDGDDLIGEAITLAPAAAVLVSGDDGDYIVGPATPPAPLIETCVWCGTWTPLGVCCAACKQPLPTPLHRTSRTLVEELPYSDHAATA